jgi:hypothetical protein
MVSSPVGNIISNKKLAFHAPVGFIRIRAIEAEQVLKSFGWNVATNLFGHLPHNTVDKAFVAFPVTSKQAYFAGLHNVGLVIPALKQDAAVRIDQDRGRDFADRILHGSPLLNAA